MDISLLLKIAGVGILVAVLYQVVSKFGGEDQAKYVSIAGIIIVILMLITEIGKLYETIQSVFGI